MHNKRLIVAVFVAGLSHVAGAQELVANGGFEQPVVNQPWVQRPPATTFGDWTVDNVGQGIVQVASFGDPSAFAGAQCLELNFYRACGVSQTLETQPGRTYTLTFVMAGQLGQGPDVKSMIVDCDGETVTTVHWSRSATGGQWAAHSFNLTASGPQTVLHFFGLTDVDGGPYLDSVSVTPSCLVDFDCDGFVTGIDFDLFVLAFEAGGATADFDGDGFITGIDFDLYVQAFEAGC